MRHAVTIILLLSLLSIFSCQTVDQVIQNTKKPKYSFADEPYHDIDLVDRDLYNYVFALTKNRLKYYVDQTFNSYPELIGLVLDLNMKGHKKLFKDIIESPVQFGWRIYDEDIIPLSSKEIAQLNRGSTPNCEICRPPKVRYLVQQKGDKATVYVSYWLLQHRTYNFIYVIERKGRAWTLIDSIEK